MAAEGIVYRVDDRALLERLAAVDRVAANPAVIMEALAAYMVTAGERHIERETGPDGQAWPELSPRTAAKRVGRRLRGTENMLRVSGRLYQSMTSSSTATEAVAGTNLAYAAAQHEGATIAMPAREQDIHLGRTNRGKRFVKASARRKETMRVQVGAHTITIPPRPWLYLDADERTEMLEIAADGFRAEAGLQ